MKAVVFCALVGLVLAVAKPVFKEEEYQVLFSRWMSQHGKKYETKDFFHRYNVFKANLDFVYKHNQLGHSYTVGMNAFGDLTNSEFSLRNGYRGRNRNYAKSKNGPSAAGVAKRAGSNPTSVDWTQHLTPVKNQGQCGSCWSFSTTGSVEGALSIAERTTGDRVVSLSEQQLMDCSQAEGNQGCNGGLMDQAFEYIIKSASGLCTEAEYPYQEADSACAAYSVCAGNHGVGTITGYTDVEPSAKTDGPLENAVAITPVSIAIEADSMAFQFYSSGVFDNSGCGTNLDHGVLIAGYGTAGGKQYWNVKNSWGSGWGDNGYIQICKGASCSGGQTPDGMCGIQMDPSYPTGAHAVSSL